MNMRPLPLSILLALAILVPGQARAGKIYAGVSAGRTAADDGLSDLDDGSLSSVTVDDSATAYKVFAGLRFFKFLAIEADWIDLGDVTANAISDGMGTMPPMHVAGPVMATRSVDGYRLSALGVIPLGKRFSVFARYGYFDWDELTLITDAGGTTPVSDSDDDDFYGAGVVVKFRGAISLRLEYEMMTLGDSDVDLASAGLALRF